MGVLDTISQLDPHKIVFATETILYPLLFSSLVKYDPDGEIVGDLAESWTVSDDLSTYTFALNPAATFSTGDPVTAEAVKASIERALDPETGFVFAFFLSSVDSVDAPDSATVVVNLKTPSSSLLPALTLIQVVDPKSLATLGTAPVGSGPYVLEDFVPDQVVALKANPNYWGDKAQLGTIEITRTPDATAAVASLRSGDLGGLLGIPWQDVKALADDPAVQTIAGAENGAAVILQFDTTSPPFNDPKAREALSYAVNRELIRETVYAGNGTLASTNSPVSADDVNYAADLPAHQFDLARAEALLAEAGIPEGSKVVYWTPAENRERGAIGEILQADFAKIGLELEIQPADSATFADKFAPAGKSWPDMIVPNIYGVPFDAGIMLSLFVPGICECNYDNPEFTDTVLKAIEEPDEATRKALYAQAQAIISAESPIITVLHTSTPLGMGSGFSGAYIDPGNNPHLEYVAAQ